MIYLYYYIYYYTIIIMKLHYYVGELKNYPHYRYIFCSWLYCWLGM